MFLMLAIVGVLAGLAVSVIYWKCYDFFLSRSDFFHLSPWSYYSGKLVGALGWFVVVLYIFTAFGVSTNDEQSKIGSATDDGRTKELASNEAENPSVPVEDQKYAIKYEPSCRSGVPYLVCQDRRLLKLENKMNELQPSAMHYDVSPFYYRVSEYLKEELLKCGQDPNCYEHYYKLGIDSYALIIEAGKNMREAQKRCDQIQACWDQTKQDAQVALSVNLQFLN